MNTLYYGDNLDILREHVDDRSVDLIYLDPPFQSNKDYNILFSEQDGTRAAAQIKAFGDTWKWDVASAGAFAEVVDRGGQVSLAMQAFRTLLGGNDVLAYLSMMAPRLIELQRVLKPNGSIYLHCDPTASHYLKLLMDSIFGPKNFRNEIIWHYRKWPTGKYTFQRNHDVIFFYSNSATTDRVFNQLYMERAASTLKRFGRSRIISGHDETGNRLPSEIADEDSEGVRMDDVWEIGRVPPIKQLYPTEKPLALLQRIIEASSHEGQVVLDPFCGCGTAVVAANGMERKWIGIDITHLAVGLIKHRLEDAFPGKAVYQVVGEPVSLPDAEKLAAEDKYQFEAWALGLVGARVNEKKKGADKGIDGRLFFHDENDASVTKRIIISVKGGSIPANHIRELRGVIDRENAEIGALLTFKKPTAPMKAEAADAGFYQSRWGTRHPRLQILTIEELLDGKRIDYPRTNVNVTFKKADKYEQDPVENLELGFGGDQPERR
ncbi:MAG: restriction endonuclease [Pyrinomonadaceae bacterium]|nr:restriction endonuclease [Pyrinomonadaceae bacterium]